MVTTARDLTFAQAVGDGLACAMREDPRVWIFGEDVAAGGAYGASQGLLAEFGPARVRDTPISEIAIAGFAVGAAMTGTRPVPEIMHMDFAACAMDQLVNQMAKMRYMAGGKTSVPVTVRCGVGGWLGAAAQHSQSLEAWFTHIPGLKVAASGTAGDAKGVLLAAIRDDNPTIVLEPLALFPTRGEVPEEAYERPAGVASRKREGGDLTIVTWGGVVPRVLEAAERLGEQGVEADVLDLLWLKPLDGEAILASLARTHRLLVVHQAYRRSGFGAEIVAYVNEHGFDLLDQPVHRVAGLDVPIPFAPPLEEYVLPSVERIVQAALDLA